MFQRPFFPHVDICRHKHNLSKAHVNPALSTVLSLKLTHLFIDGWQPDKKAEDKEKCVIDEPRNKKFSLVIESPEHEADVDEKCADGESYHDLKKM